MNKTQYMDFLKLKILVLSKIISKYAFLIMDACSLLAIVSFIIIDNDYVFKNRKKKKSAY